MVGKVSCAQLDKPPKGREHTVAGVPPRVAEAMEGNCSSGAVRPGSSIKLANRDPHLLKIFYFLREKHKDASVGPPSTRRAQVE